MAFAHATRILLAKTASSTTTDSRGPSMCEDDDNNDVVSKLARTVELRIQILFPSPPKHESGMDAGKFNDK